MSTSSCSSTVVAGIIFVSGMHADATADHAPYNASSTEDCPSC